VSSPATLGFAGTPEFAVPSLAALLATPHPVCWALTQPDRPAGRGRQPAAPPVKHAALAAGLRVAQPERLQDASVLAGLERPDLVVVVAYGLMLPRWFREWPALGCVNVHASLLPRWRGAAPIQHAVLAGDAETGVSLMRITARLDAGPVYAQRALAIRPGESAGELHDRLASLGAQLLAESLEALLAGRLPARPQDEGAVTYAPKLTKPQAALDWRESAESLARQVRAFNPWPVAEATLESRGRLRIWEAESLLEGSASAPPGTILCAADVLEVATGRGRLRLLKIQAPGSRVMSARDYLNAHPLGGARFAPV